MPVFEGELTVLDMSFDSHAPNCQALWWDGHHMLV